MLSIIYDSENLINTQLSQHFSYLLSLLQHVDDIIKQFPSVTIVHRLPLLIVCKHAVRLPANTNTPNHIPGSGHTIIL